jgi:hypothetical protein
VTKNGILKKINAMDTAMKNGTLKKNSGLHRLFAWVDQMV